MPFPLPDSLIQSLPFLVHNTPNTVIITDSLGVILYVNAAFSKISGFSAFEVVGRELTSLALHDPQSTAQYDWQSLCRGESWEGQVVSVRKNGERYIEHCSLLPILDAQQDITLIAFIKRDISERVRVEKDLLEVNRALARQVQEQKATELELAQVSRQNDLILNSVVEGIFGVDIEGSITFLNAAAEKMTGYQGDELFGTPYYLFFTGYNDADVPSEPSDYPVYASFKDGKVHSHAEETFCRRDGSTFPVHLVSAPIIEDETVIGAVVLFRDITEELLIQRQKEQAEAKLRELTETLEQRVEKRTSQLHSANEDLINTLDQLQNAQSQLVESEKMAALGGLVAGVAHEINTPVGIAYTAATHLEKETGQLVDIYRQGDMKRSNLEEYLNTCQESMKLLLSNLNRAGALIRSFKQVAIDQSGEARRDFVLRDYLDEIILSLRPILKRKTHTITIDCANDIHLHTYAGAFSQIVTNLITNSVTHAFRARESGNITIRASMEGSTLVFCYEDNGRGIPALDLEQIFDPFFTTNRKKGGSGLGLHIIYNIVTQQLNGTISCQSEPGKGVLFTLRIPMEQRLEIPIGDGN